MNNEQIRSIVTHLRDLAKDDTNRATIVQVWHAQ